MITSKQVLDALSAFYKQDSHISGMNKALQAYEQSKWVSVKDRLPDEWCTVILKFKPDDLEEIGFRNCTYTARYSAPNDGLAGVVGFYDCDPFDEWHIEPTHWQPLPEFKE